MCVNVGCCQQTTLKQEELSSRSSHIKESRVLSSRENIGDSREQVEVHQPEGNHNYS